MPAIKDITGQRFGRLIVEEKLGRSERGAITWRCRCDCGNTKTTITSRLLNGEVKSCGCMLVKGDLRIKKDHEHGYSTTKMYECWADMKRRCNNKNHKNYHQYGGRGITIDPRWNSFKNFLADMGPKPENLTIERVDNNGPYCKSNCRWASMKEQANNKRTNVLITFKGETKTVSQWASELNMLAGTLYARIKDYGWSVEEALTTPVGQSRTNPRQTR